MKKNLPFLLLCLLFAASILTNCKKDPEIITNTIVETDTVIVHHHDTLIVTSIDTITLTNFILDTATTFILTRHAETTGGGTDPSLSAAGLLRADELVRILKNVPVAAVYSTNYNRTKQTVQAVATDKSLTINIYGTALGTLADGILQNHQGGVVLVVGHSNTTPDLLNVLTGTNDYQQLPDTEYDNLYVVTVFEKGRAQVVHFKYGD